MSLEKQILHMAQRAKKAAQELSLIPTAIKNDALKRMASNLLARKAFLLKENYKDLSTASQKGYGKALTDRLTLNEKRIQEMAQCLLETARLKDPVGEVMKTIHRPNGLIIKKVRTPFGVVGIIYESRPNVTSDCVGLCLKSGNASILKGGKEAFYSNRAIVAVLREALRKTGIPMGVIHFVETVDRKAVDFLLKLNQYIDLIVPRGGEGLIRYVVEHSRIPVIKHDKGVCHIFVSDQADLGMAHNICMNAKTQRPGVCNAMEAMLVHKRIADKFLPKIAQDLKKAGVEIRGCPRTYRILKGHVKKATPQDWGKEYLDLILAIKVVDNLSAAIDHINTYGSRHSDAIITEDKKQAEQFLKSVDSACLYVNASTRFTDGYQFGFGAEVGISTDKLHARGPMALEELTTYKYVVYGQGQIRQ